MNQKQRYEEFHQIVLEQRKIHLPQIICFVCQSENTNRKKMYCTQCHAILCSQHKDQEDLKKNCQHNFKQYFESCPGCGTIMKEDIKENNELTQFDETLDHICFYKRLNNLLTETKMLQSDIKIYILTQQSKSYNNNRQLKISKRLRSLFLMSHKKKLRQKNKQQKGIISNRKIKMNKTDNYQYYQQTSYPSLTLSLYNFIQFHFFINELQSLHTNLINLLIQYGSINIFILLNDIKKQIYYNKQFMEFICKINIQKILKFNINYLKFMNLLIYQTFDEIPKRFLCQYCFNFPKNPVKCNYPDCQAMYCKNCKNVMEKNEIQCVKCNYQSQCKQIDAITQYLISEMHIICTNCKCFIKASKYQKHQKYCQQQNIQQELEYFKHIQKQMDIIQIIICTYCNKKCGFLEFFIMNFNGIYLFNQYLNLCQCMNQQKLIQEDNIQLFIQSNFECEYCHYQILFQDLIHHFYICLSSQTNCQVEECQWRNKRSLFKSHYINCIIQRQQSISSTNKLVESILESEDIFLDTLGSKIDQMQKNKQKALNSTFLNDRQQTDSQISSPSYVFNPEYDWPGLFISE